VTFAPHEAPSDGQGCSGTTESRLTGLAHDHPRRHVRGKTEGCISHAAVGCWDRHPLALGEPPPWVEGHGSRVAIEAKDRDGWIFGDGRRDAEFFDHSRTPVKRERKELGSFKPGRWNGGPGHQTTRVGLGCPQREADGDGASVLGNHEASPSAPYPDDVGRVEGRGRRWLALGEGDGSVVLGARGQTEYDLTAAKRDRRPSDSRRGEQGWDEVGESGRG
jgi:hypothetical protein